MNRYSLAGAAVLLPRGIAPINKGRPDDVHGGVTFDQTAATAALRDVFRDRDGLT